MRIILRIISFLFMIPATAFCISDAARVSVLTFEPGNEYYTIFGHTAIRISDKSLNLDRVYNFGTFNFNTPYFYLKFLKGSLFYYLAVDDFEYCLAHWLADHRKVYEQELDMNGYEKQRIFQRLEKCYHSEDRYYRYDFLYDNCATRVRDAVFLSVEDADRYDTVQYCNRSFRQLLKPYMAESYWVDLGVNLAMGKEADKIAESWHTMFLPDYIMFTLENSKIGKEKRILLDGPVAEKHRINMSWIMPWVIAVSLVLLSFYARIQKVILYSLLAFVGFNGLFILTVSLISENSGFINNLNVIWTIPSLLVLFLRPVHLNDYIKLMYSAFLILIMAFWKVLPQALSVSFLPWILLLLILLVLDLRFVRERFGIVRNAPE
ncbi:MAG: DUF4105 domain-containing protein [Bacteroidales bacterium]|nr:DUF4105 domain-containing protein [Bacteroidales bacterium]